jgi:hypothetical protein
VTFADVAGYAQPVRIEHRIEDMALCSDAQINGDLTLTRPLTHDFPLGSLVSSALIMGDLHARVSVLVRPADLVGVWSDTVIGSGARVRLQHRAVPGSGDQPRGDPGALADHFHEHHDGQCDRRDGRPGRHRACDRQPAGAGQPGDRRAVFQHRPGRLGRGLVRRQRRAAQHRRRQLPGLGGAHRAAGAAVETDDQFIIGIRGDVDTP